MAASQLGKAFMELEGGASKVSVGLGEPLLNLRVCKKYWIESEVLPKPWLILLMS